MENPVVPCKRKHIQVITDYCLDAKVEFTIRPGDKNDEFETEFHINDITRAVALGMFLRENRLYLKGMEPATKGKKAEKDKSPANEETAAIEEEKPVSEYQDNGLQFDLAEEN